MKTINEIIKNAYEKFGDRNFIFTKHNDEYTPITYKSFLEKSDAFARLLLDDGLSGKNIMVIGKNSVEYMIADLAVTAYIGACANVNYKLDYDSLVQIIEHGDIIGVLYDEELTEKITKLKEKYPNLKFRELQSTVKKLSKSEQLFNFPEKDMDVCSKIIFTSGTTDKPKGVMLSLRNIFCGWEPLYARTHFGDNGAEVVYVFLPLSHTYCNIYNFLYSFIHGPELYLSSSTDKIASELIEVRPTIFCAVPTIYRRLYDAYGKNIGQAFGDRIKYLYVGGAVFDKKLKTFYYQHNLPILEAYALTETASSFAVDYYGSDDIDGTGTIYENIDVKIVNKDDSGIGDILVKGDSVFLGYLNEPEKTAAAFTENGYFITGDYGFIKNKKIHVLGRRKDVIVGENGENVYLEELLAQLNKINDVVTRVSGEVSEDGKIFYKIYTKKGSEDKIAKMIKEYNTKALKKDRITAFKVLIAEENLQK